ncbi:MAG: GTPase HflX [Clostridia bacterium]
MTEEIIKKAILVNVTSEKDAEKPFEELERLADTAGYQTVGYMTQKREYPDKATYIGKGKLEELKAAAEVLEADIIIFDNDINGSQFNNLESVLNIDVIDRRTLILEIFSRHAVSNEGKLQVELAQKRNMLPRILGKGMVLSRQGGGGGGGGGARRGGGEQQLELDRRTLRKEIADLETRINKLTEERQLRRAKRQKNELKVVSIVGYTNAGKSTLMNSLTKAGVRAEDKLFATLDPVSRKFWLDTGKEFLLIDTVGFISRLPHELIKAFRSTLEESKYADLILHIVDGASENALSEFDTVNEVLSSIGITETPILTVINKSDLGAPEFIPQAENIVVVSAKTGEGMDALKDKISEMLFTG